MSEIEVPTEHLHEHLEHAAGGHSASASWITWGALLSAVFAVLAAIAALQAGHLANEGMVEQIKASDTWSYYQAKSIKANLLETRMQMSAALGKNADPEAQAKLKEYASEQAELQKAAKEKEDSSAHSFHSHEIFSRAVTFFQIAIAVTAIAVLARRKHFLWVAGAFGCVGLFFVIQGFISVGQI